MKKILSLLLATALVMSMSLSALAAEMKDTVGQNGEKEISVTAKYDSSTEIPNVYSVDISWTSMTFTYTEKDTKTWNAADHSYKTATEGAWDKTTATITVTNHSNVAVKTNVVYSAVEGTGVSGTMTDAAAALNAGVEGNYSGADTHTATLTISGTPNKMVTSDGITVGTIKITIGE